MPLQTPGPAQAITTAMASNEGPTDLPEASASQAPAEGGQRPPFGEKSFLLTVAQRAKEAAAAGATIPQYHLPTCLQARRLNSSPLFQLQYGIWQAGYHAGLIAEVS